MLSNFLRSCCKSALPATLLAVLVFAPVDAAMARTLTICISDRPTPPLSYPDRDGIVQTLIRRAAGQLGSAVRFVVAPSLRCSRGVNAGVYDGAATKVATDEHRALLAFPLRGDQPDPQRAVAQVRFVLVQRKGEAIRWDGKQLLGLKAPVLYSKGIRVVHDRLQQLGVAGDDGPKFAEQMLEMLQLRRAQVAVLLEVDALRLMHKPTFSTQIELLAPPLLLTDVYLALSPALRDHDPAYAEALWSAIGRIRASPDWQQLEAAAHLAATQP